MDFWTSFAVAGALPNFFESCNETTETFAQLPRTYIRREVREIWQEQLTSSAWLSFCKTEDTRKSWMWEKDEENLSLHLIETMVSCLAFVLISTTRRQLQLSKGSVEHPPSSSDHPFLPSSKIFSTTNDRIRSDVSFSLKRRDNISHNPCFHLALFIEGSCKKTSFRDYFKRTWCLLIFASRKISQNRRSHLKSVSTTINRSNFYWRRMRCTENDKIRRRLVYSSKILSVYMLVTRLSELIRC